MRLKDWQGIEYGVGDYVVWPTVSGSSPSMSAGIVLDIYRVKNSGYRMTGERVSDSYEEPPVLPGHVSILSNRVQVQPLHSGTSVRGDWKDWNKPVEDRKPLRKVTLVNTRNITVVIYANTDSGKAGLLGMGDGRPTVDVPQGPAD